MSATQVGVQRRRARKALLPMILAVLATSLLAPVLGAEPSTSTAPQASLTNSETWAPWMQLFGRMHIMLVHFPIGLLIAAAIIEVFFTGRKGPRPSSATLVCLGLGWIAAAFASYAGWTYAEMERHGHASDGLLFWHRWGGIGVASLSFLAWNCGMLARSGKRLLARKGFYFFLFFSTVLTGVVGHLGGSLVYGDDYLTEPFSESARARRARQIKGENEDDDPAIIPVVDPIEEDSPQAGSPELLPGADALDVGEGASALVGGTDQAPVILTEAAAYAAVEPVLGMSCTHCHGSRKAKAGLRLHDLERLFEADPIDWVIVPGHPQKSELMRRVSLPLDHEDSMPSDDDPLPADEIALIEAWIASMDPVAHGLASDGGNAGSAILGDWNEVLQASAVEVPTEPESAPADDSEQAPAAGSGSDSSQAVDASAVPELLEALGARGAVANRVAADSDAVEVVFGLLRESVTDADLVLLEGLEGVLVALDLAHTSVTDVGLGSLADFTALERLHLENTAIGNTGLVHLAGLESLQYLNLYGTGVTDAGLEELRPLKSLGKLYLWQTGVSDDGVASLQAALPELEIVRDLALPAPPPALVVVEGETTYVDHIGPILSAKCSECHGDSEPAGGLSFSSFDAIFAGPWAEWTVRPGDAESSRMLQAVKKDAGSEGAMPKKGERLTADELELLVAWVSELREEEEQVEDLGQ